MYRHVAAVFLALALVALAAKPAASAGVNNFQILVNQDYQVSESYTPPDLVNLNNYMFAGRSVTMDRTAAEALAKMLAAAKRDGVSDFYGSSAYRAYSTQKTLNEQKTGYYLNLGYDQTEAYRLASTVVAPPGTSEHQTGLAIDFTTSENDYSMTESFAATQAGQWLAGNCWKYGFVLRYPEDKTEVTGYIYEPWHFRYVGAPHAEYMYKNNLCLEEYLALLRAEGTLELTDGAGGLYTVYYDQYDVSSSLAGSVINVSTAFARVGGYVVTARPALYDIIGHWSEPEVRALISYGLIGGYPDKTFRPSREVSRAELVTLLARLYALLWEKNAAGTDNAQSAVPGGNNVPSPGGADAGEDTPPFADVGLEDYYYAALLKTYALGLVPGSMVREENGRLYFDAETKVLRRQMAESVAPLFILAGRSDPLAEESAGSSSGILRDLAGEDGRLQQAVRLLAAYGVIKGDENGNFNPDKRITRAEISAVLNRVIISLLPPEEEQPADPAADPAAAERASVDHAEVE